MLQIRDIEIIASVARYYTLTRAQINRLHFPNDHDGRVTRRRLRFISDEGLISRTHMQVVNPVMGAPMYVYYPSSKGCAFLAQELKDESYKAVNTRTPNWTRLYHWVDLADTHILLDQSIAKVEGARILDWITEGTIINPDEKEPEKRYKLYTKLGPKLVCIPDAAFLLEKDGFRKAFYVELDRDTTMNADRVASQKCHGYASLFERRVHLSRHFPLANVDKFTVLFFTPSVRRRDALATAFSAKPAPWMYKFCAQTDLNSDTFLTGPIWYATDGTAAPLLKGGAA